MGLPPGPTRPTLYQIYRWIREPYAFLAECAATYGDAFTLRLGVLPPIVILADPDEIREVFADDGETLRAGVGNLTLKPFLGAHSVLLLDGAPHKRVRRLLLPPFHGERMQAYGTAMVNATHDVVDGWPLVTPFPIHGSMQSVTLQVILRTVFGVEDNATRSQLGALLTDLLEIASWPGMLFPQVQHDLGPWSPWGRFVRASAQADRVLADVVARRRESGARGTDVLSLLLDARDEEGQPLSAEELRDQLVTLLVAGHETTATGLAWAFHWLLANPACEARLAAEVHAAFADGVPAPEQLARLPYLDAVVRESLRLQPVIPLVARWMAEPTRIGRWDLPKGVVAAPSIFLAHHRRQAFPDGDRFRPERFLEARFSGSEWFPFGGGVRRCLGIAFALYEMKMVLATVFSRATLRPAPGPAVRAVRRSITLSPSRGMPVVLVQRSPRPVEA